MRKFLIIILMMIFFIRPVNAMEYTAPEVPDSAQDLFPEERSTFAEDVWKILQKGMERLRPAIVTSLRLGTSVLAVTIGISTITAVSGHPSGAIDLAGAVAVSAILLSSSDAFIRTGVQTVHQLSEYGKLLIPVMTGALAAQGAGNTSAAIYAGTVAFDAVLSGVISKILTPLIYIFLCISIANASIAEKVLEQVRNFVKWLISWGLKSLMYVFTGYIGITGVISGTVDAAAVKATKLTLSGVVPVVGGILSDASEAVLVSAGLMKNAAGIYGLLALLAVVIEPFLKIGFQYLVLKLTAALGAVLGSSKTTSLISDFSSAMGLVLAMTGATCIMLMISTVCFMRGVG